MIRPQFTLDLNDELILDFFAGGGGGSTGIEAALGRHVDYAVNHDRYALGMHRINHPQSVHLIEDVFDVNPWDLCRGRKVGLAHFSPDCKHFSKAKGGKPLDKKIRGLVLYMLRWAKYGARVMTMENVEEIAKWGPLKWMLKNGQWGWYPDPDHMGRTWLAFLSCLREGIDSYHPDLQEILDVVGDFVSREDLIRGFGRSYEHREVRACDHDTPTIRKRLFLITRNDGRPIVWPEATNAAPHKITPDMTRRGILPYRMIAECIQWDLPCPSIFLTKAEAKLLGFNVKRPLVPSTLQRLAAGIGKYVMHSGDPFIVSLTHQGGDRVESITEPAKTVTGAKRGEKGLCSPVMVQTGHYSTNSHMVKGAHEPMRTQATGASHAVGTAVLAPLITEHANGSSPRNMPVSEGLRTQCAQVKGGHFALACGTLVHTAHGERSQDGKKRGRGAHDLRESMPTALGTNDCALGAVTLGAGGPAYSGKPRSITAPGNAQTTESHAAIGMIKLRGGVRTHLHAPAVTEPGHVVSAGGQHHGLFAANLIRQFGESVGQEVGTAGPTVMPGGQGKTALLAAALAQHNGGFNETPAHPVTEPVTTLSSKGSQQQLIAASVVDYYGSEADGQAVDKAARTVRTRDGAALAESYLLHRLTPEQEAGALRVAKFLREYGVEFEGPYAMVHGYVIVDIGMRMLTPRELFRAQGFPDSYVIDHGYVVNPQTAEVERIEFTKEQQIRFCGNSVCPNVMRDLVRANVPELATWFNGERPKSKVRRQPMLQPA